jgi:hypothetical protein
MTDLEFKKQIIAFFKKNSGLTITQAKAQIKKVMVIDKWGNQHNSEISAKNVRVFYTHNSNFANGVKNGYGRGWYITNVGFTGGRTIKLSAKL